MLRHTSRILGFGVMAVVGALALDLATPSSAALAAAAAVTPAATSAGPASTPPPQDSSSNYIIGPGDMIEVYVWNNPNLTVTIPVRPDGKVSTPLVENMVAVGKTPSQLARDIEKVLAVYVRSPKVNIIVTQPIGALTDVKVIGQVTRPGAFPFHAGMTVLDVVLQAGGLTQFAAGNRARIIRKAGGKEQVIRVKLGRLLEKGDVSQNVPLQPDDVIDIPETLF